jgi:hypothetical protein
MRRAIALVLLALSAAACSGGGSDEAKPYSAVDVGWIEHVNSWYQQYQRQGAGVAPVYNHAVEQRGDLSPLRKVLQPYLQCTTSLGAKVGEPENDQLRRAYTFLREACDRDQRYARALLKSAQPNPGYPTAEQFRQSDLPFHEAFQAVEAGLIANRSLPVRDSESDESRVEARLSKAASALTVQEIEVRCWSDEEWPSMREQWNAYSDGTGDVDGFVTGATRVQIQPSSCKTLAAFLYGDGQPTDEQGLEELAEAVGLVAHETEHLYERDAGEAETECYAAQDVRPLARSLGASQADADRLAALYWSDVYPTQRPEYRSEQCRKDGPFDRHPETPVFP